MPPTELPAPVLVLASASPRRRELLSAAGLCFSIEPSEVDEEIGPGVGAEQAAVEIARRKARAVAQRHADELAFVLAADTVVALDAPEGQRLLGKPADAAEARAMLEALSGSRHRVVTGVVAIECSGERRERLGFERTWVHMRPIHPDEIEAYVRSGEWEGKAGGYAIQESADAFVTALEEGGFDNVVGLPVALSLGLLAACGFQGWAPGPDESRAARSDGPEGGLRPPSVPWRP